MKLVDYVKNLTNWHKIGKRSKFKDGKKAKKKAGWKKAGKVAAAALTGGLDAVYGSGSIAPVSVGTSFANSDVETAEEKTDRLLKRKNKA